MKKKNRIKHLALLSFWLLSLISFSSLNADTRESVDIQQRAVNIANPRLTARDYFNNNDEIESKDLELQKLHIEIELFGGYARTEVSAVFHNPTEQDLEAYFEMQLPQNSELIGFGLDVNDSMIPGVLLGKERAKKVFNQRVRENIDPGLAEITRTNVFKNRVYPVFSKKTRQVSMTFVAPLGADGFSLPLLSYAAIQDFKLTIKTDKQERYTVDGVESKRVERKASRDEVVYSGEKITLDSELLIQLQDTFSSFIERNEAGQRFVHLQVPLKRQQLRKPKTLAVFWDNSLSMQANAASLLLKLSGLKSTYADASITLQAFNHRLTEPKIVGGFDGLLSQLTKMDYDGATRLSQVQKAMTLSAADECWVFTDGDRNFDAEPLASMQAQCRPVYFKVSQNSNEALLMYLAKVSGGTYIRSQAIADIKNELLDPVTLPDGLNLDGQDTLAESEWQLFDDHLAITAPIRRQSKILTLKLGTEAESIELNELAVFSKRLVSPFWAQARLTMQREDDFAYDDLVDFSRKYSVASKETSFLVLERLEEYVENNLPLPKVGFTPSQHKHYQSLIQAKLEADEEALLERKDNVMHAWKEQKKWYVTDFSERKNESMKRKLANFVEGLSREELAEADHEAAPMSIESVEDEQQEEVVVTGSRQQSANKPNPKIAMDLNTWKPEREYLKVLNGLCAKNFMRQYYELRKQYGSLPSFYLETADAMAECGDSVLSLNIVLSALELSISDNQTITAVAQRLLKYGAYTEAIALFERAVKQNETSPQALRNLALAIEQDADIMRSKANKQQSYQRALEYLNTVINRVWAASDDGIEMISLMEANRIISKLNDVGGSNTILADEFVAEMPVDLRILIDWNVDIVDMDLWVIEPNGEKSVYSNPLTAIGGRLSNDMTDGLGPEEYLLRNAPKGEYQIFVHYYGSDIISPNGAVTVSAKVFKNWGQANAESNTVDLEFTSTEQKEYLVGKVSVQ